MRENIHKQATNTPLKHNLKSGGGGGGGSND
jgi:hypothetical protein